MNNFYVITKRMKDARNDINQGYPDEWPAEGEEFETLEDASAAHPGQPVLTIAEYNQFKLGLDMAEPFIPKPGAVESPWWNFWSKP